MKLFIAGSDSQDPEDWSMWVEVAIVAANNVEEVERLTWQRPIVELDPKKIKEPTILMQEKEPAWGDDL